MQNTNHGSTPINWREIVENDMPHYNKILCIDSTGWPIERIINKPLKTWLRRLLLTRKIMTYRTWLKRGGCKIKFS